MVPISPRDEKPVLWVAEPNFRGTFGIFSLCFSTLLISVWSAVHMDIPTHRPSMYRSFVNSVLWMAAALFCPELLLFIAFNQRSNAMIVLKQAIDLLPLPTDVKRHGDSSSSLIEGIRQQVDRSS
jgi:hypothetical protein